MSNSNKIFIAYLSQLLIVITFGLYLLIVNDWQFQTNLLSLLPKSESQTADKQINALFGQASLLQAQDALFGDNDKKIIIALSLKEQPLQQPTLKKPSSQNTSIQQVENEGLYAAHQALVNEVGYLASVEIAQKHSPTINEIASFYAPYKDNFISESYRNNLNQPQALQSLMLAQLTQVANPFVSATLEISPRLALADYLQNAVKVLAEGEESHGMIKFSYQNKAYYLTSLILTMDSFSVKNSQILAANLQTIFKKVADDFSVDLIYSGVLFHTAESSKQAEHEISTFGFLSLIAIVLLVLFVFRSMSPLLISMLVLLLATFYGFVGVLLFFNELHLLTLVFAVTLIGIVIDYCFHGFVSIESSPTLGSIIKPLLLGFFTTALGYSALMFSPLPLLSQVAVFILFGLCGALSFVLVVLPMLNAKQKINAIQVHSSVKSMVNILIDKQTQLTRFRGKVFLVSALLLLLSLFVKTPHFNDDIRLLNSSPQWLIEQEKRIAQVTGYQNNQRIILRAKTSQALLEKQELVIKHLKANQAQLTIKSIADLLPSLKQQKASHQQIEQAQINNKFDLGLNLMGLTDPVTAFNGLDYPTFLQGPLSQLTELYFKPVWLNKNHKIFVSWLAITESSLESSGLNKKNLDWIAQQPQVDIYNRVKDFSSTLSQYRQSILNLLMIAFLLVAVILFALYRFKQGVLGLMAIVFSALGALIISHWLLGYLNIFNLLAVLLILALAIDYVIFYQEQGTKVSTVLAVTLSAFSSALVFGMLAFSITPAVQSFGITVMLGIVFIFILAPLCINKR